MLKSQNGGIYRSKTSRMVAVYNDKTEILHTYYGLDIRVRNSEEADEVLKEFCLEDGPLVQFKALLTYRSEKTGNRTLGGDLVNWARNMGLDNREIADIWLDHFFPE